jgi:hypothetical protein
MVGDRAVGCARGKALKSTALGRAGSPSASGAVDRGGGDPTGEIVDLTQIRPHVDQCLLHRILRPLAIAAHHRHDAHDTVLVVAHESSDVLVGQSGAPLRWDAAHGQLG